MKQYCRIDACLMCADTMFDAMTCEPQDCKVKELENVCTQCAGFTSRYYIGCINEDAVKSSHWKAYWSPPEGHIGHRQGYMTSDDVERAFGGES